MPRIYSSLELRSASEATSVFIDAAEALAEDRQNQDLRRSVAEAAGRADRASEMAGFRIVHTDPPAAGGRSVVYDPIKNWNAAVSPFSDALAEAIEAAHQIRGMLESSADRAEREEKSAVGRTARILGFASRVRSHLADRGFSKRAQNAGFAVSIAGQVAIGIVASMLAAVLVTLIW